VTNVDGGTLRHAQVDNEGAYGRFVNLAPGASQAINATDTARDFVCEDGIATTVRVVIS
jgi:hypothetical protein